MIKDFFDKLKNSDNKKADGEPKPPVNLFSKPLNVSQSDEARRARLKTVIIEAVIFGAFLTAITVIYSLSGMDLALNPEAEATTPSLFFFFTEFVLCTALVGVGNYFLTEKRVNDYNQKVAGLAFNIDEEIEKAIKEQEEEGLTEEEIAALNRADGEELPEVEISARDAEAAVGYKKTIEAFADDKKVGGLNCAELKIVDSHGFEQPALLITSFEIDSEFFSEKLREKLCADTAKKLFAALKESASADGCIALIAPQKISDFGNLGMQKAEKFSLSFDSLNLSKYGFEKSEKFAVTEAYSGSLMGVSGELCEVSLNGEPAI